MHLTALALRSEWHGDVLDQAVEHARAVKDARTAVKDKTGALVQLARILAPVSEEDARAVFESAVSAAGEADRDLAFALATVTDVIARGVDRLDMGGRRETASRLVVAATDIGLRLEGTDTMPWEAVTEALVRLDPGLAFAAVARWDDEAVVPRQATLGSALESGIATGAISAERAAALMLVMEHVEADLVAAIVIAGETGPSEKRHALAEELARDECLYLGRGEREAVIETLARLAGHRRDRGWIAALEDLARMDRAGKSDEDARTTRTSEHDAPGDRLDLLASIDWSSRAWTTAEAIDATVDDLVSKRREAGAALFQNV